MRHPNGYGSVYKLSGKRRNPFAARITVGFNPDNGYPLYKFIGYYKTRSEALQALALYNNNPEKCAIVDNRVVATSSINLERVYDEWYEEFCKTIKPQSLQPYKTAEKILSPLFGRSFESLTIRDYEDLFEESGRSRNTLTYTKTALKGMYKFAYRKGYINDVSLLNIAENISLGDAENTARKTKHKAFTKEELDILWKHQDEPDVQVVLFLIYTGLRIGELANLRISDVNLDEHYIKVRESKTEAGVRRVPINDKVVFILENWMMSGRELVAPLGSTPMVRKTPGRNGFDSTINRLLSVRHLQHDTRYTLATLLTEATVDERYIKLILGHKQQDVTNRVYAAKLDIGVLLNAINQV